MRVRLRTWSRTSSGVDKLQPRPPPDALDPLGVHVPTFGPEQGSDPPIAISAILAGQADDRGRECLFIIPTTGSLALG